MRRVIVPALVAVAMVASSSVNASAFGLFDKLCRNNCDACCDVEPACGCEATCAAACEPACGCEVADPCCDAGCCKPKMGLLHRLFAKHCNACDSCCEPTCAAPAACCEPTCAAPAACCEPACGCEVADACCDAPRHSRIKGLLGRLFHKNSCCDSDCCAEPACGCEAACEPACGCEPTCGCN